MIFKHLEKAKQSYTTHFKDSIGFSLVALKASFYFLIHCIIPDFYERDGSNLIKELNEILQRKIKKCRD
jgi:hypothetical protein